MTPPLVPAYNKPDAPGIWMNFDNTVSLYHVVGPDDDFEQAAQDLFALLQAAQAQYPAWPRVLYLDIQGHTDALGRLEPDFVELQQEFLILGLGRYFTALDLPLVSLVNPELQDNAVPAGLAIGPPVEGFQGGGCG